MSEIWSCWDRWNRLNVISDWRLKKTKLFVKRLINLFLQTELCLSVLRSVKILRRSYLMRRNNKSRVLRMGIKQGIFSNPIIQLGNLVNNNMNQKVHLNRDLSLNNHCISKAFQITVLLGLKMFIDFLQN